MFISCAADTFGLRIRARPPQTWHARSQIGETRIESAFCAGAQLTGIAKSVTKASATAVRPIQTRSVSFVAKVNATVHCIK